MSIARSEGWRINVTRGNPGKLAGGEVVTFQGNGRISVDHSGSDWDAVAWAGGDGVATGWLPDARPFRVTLIDADNGRPALDCRIGRAVQYAGGGAASVSPNDLDGETGGWTAQEGESPIGVPRPETC